MSSSSEALRAFLEHPNRSPGTLQLDELRGFLFAVANAPEIIVPSEWIPAVFDDKEPEYAIRLLKAGAAGYVGKDVAREQLVDAIRKVSRGEKYIAGALAETVALRLVDQGEKLPHQFLSDREFQVMLLIAGGKPPREIASDLNLSVKTVGAHRARILQKMGLRNNAEVVQYVLTHRLGG